MIPSNLCDFLQDLAIFSVILLILVLGNLRIAAELT